MLAALLCNQQSGLANDVLWGWQLRLRNEWRRRARKQPVLAAVVERVEPFVVAEIKKFPAYFDPKWTDEYIEQLDLAALAELEEEELTLLM